MGLDYYTARFLLQARRDGAQFRSTLTIGRQNLFVTGPQLQKLTREFAIPSDTLADFLATQPTAALATVEPFLQKILGATHVESLDASPYEGATHIHDLNTPLPETFHSRYDTILEAGSLEHIFNFPAAIANLMRALKPGGALYIQTPANNYFGHGFYQFSPELFYRVLSEPNGFTVRRMQALEHVFPCHFFATTPYHVTDPARAGQRVQLINQRPTLLLIEAHKTAEKPILATPPQQSDYLPLWQKPTAPAPSPQSAIPNPPSAIQTPTCLQSTWKQKLYSLPLRLFGALWFQRRLNSQNQPSLKNRDFFEPAP